MTPAIEDQIRELGDAAGQPSFDSSDIEATVAGRHHRRRAGSTAAAAVFLFVMATAITVPRLGNDGADDPQSVTAGPAATTAPDILTGDVWVASGRPRMRQSVAFVRFAPDGTFEATVGCSVIDGTYTVDGRRLALDASRPSDESCTYSEGEQRVLDLFALGRAALLDGHLTLGDQPGSEAQPFERFDHLGEPATAGQLIGSWGPLDGDALRFEATPADGPLAPAPGDVERLAGVYSIGCTFGNWSVADGLLHLVFRSSGYCTDQHNTDLSSALDGARARIAGPDSIDTLLLATPDDVVALERGWDPEIDVD